MPDPTLLGALEKSHTGVKVQVSLLDTAKAVGSAFDIDLLGNGVQPVFVRIENRCNDPIHVDRQNVSLTAGELTLAQLHPEAIYARVRFSPTIRYFAWSFGLFGIGIVPGLVDGSKAINANQEMRDDFYSKLLKNRVLASGEELSGFAYFDLPKETVPEVFSIALDSAETGSDESIEFIFDLANVSQP